MKLKIMLLTLLLPLLISSCAGDDDVTEIFVSGTWYTVDFYTDANWGKRNGTAKYNTMANSDDSSIRATGRNALEVIQSFTLAFSADGTFEGRMQSGTFEGTWEADGGARTVNINFTSLPGNYTSRAYDIELVNALNNAAHYQGDSNVLMLGAEGKDTYVQFRHN